ncbi:MULTISPECIES: hypothetical protein [Streptomyces]|uniref:hypothetical protein n=1 Tax=Streptomyces TaxID=1883 RepID=UPI000B28D82C|nr:hypothetical protein [Streptomyces prasinus]
MAVEVRKKDTARPSETGWAKARRLRGQRIRTCERATIDGAAGRTGREGDWNVVRGED